MRPRDAKCARNDQETWKGSNDEDEKGPRGIATQATDRNKIAHYGREGKGSLGTNKRLRRVFACVEAGLEY